MLYHFQYDLNDQPQKFCINELQNIFYSSNDAYESINVSYQQICLNVLLDMPFYTSRTTILETSCPVAS